MLLAGTTIGWVAKLLKITEPPPQAPHEQRPVHGRLTLDADLPLTDVVRVLPAAVAAAMRSRFRCATGWSPGLSRDPVEGDGIDWHGARFEVRKLHDGQILRVGLALAPRAKVAPE